MVNIVSTTTPYGNAAQAMNLKVLQERQRAADEAMAAAQAPRQMISPWQGAAQMGQTLVAALQQSGAARQQIASQNELARLEAGFDPKADVATQMKQAALIGRIDTEAGQKMAQDIINNSQANAMETRKEGFQTTQSERENQWRVDAANAERAAKEREPNDETSRITWNYQHGVYGDPETPEAKAAYNDAWQKATYVAPTLKPTVQTSIVDRGDGNGPVPVTTVTNEGFGGIAGTHAPVLHGGGGQTVTTPSTATPGAAAAAAPQPATPQAGGTATVAPADAAVNGPNQPVATPPAAGAPAVSTATPGTPPVAAPPPTVGASAAAPAAPAGTAPTVAGINPPPGIPVTQKSVGYFDKGGSHEKYSQEAIAGTQQNQVLDATQKALEAAGPTGIAAAPLQVGGDVAESVGGILKQWGMPGAGQKVTDAARWLTGDSGARSIVNTLTLEGIQQQVQKYKGAISDKETEMFRAAQPGLQKTGEANQAIIDMQRTLNDRLILRSKMADAYALQHHGTDLGFEQEWNKYVDAHPAIDVVGGRLLVGQDKVDAAKAAEAKANAAFTGNTGAPPPAAAPAPAAAAAPAVAAPAAAAPQAAAAPAAAAPAAAAPAPGSSPLPAVPPERKAGILTAARSALASGKRTRQEVEAILQQQGIDPGEL
jgi:hypothetical protein